MILVVEDDKAILELIRISLQVAGYKVLTADSIETANKFIAGDDKIELALVDFRLGGEDAVSVFDNLHGRRPDIPFVMMSGGSANFSIESSDAVAKISGSQAFLQKPFRREELLSTVTRLLS